MGVRIEEHVPLSQYTTLKVGGAARYFCEVRTLEELKAAGEFAQQNALPFFVLGGGSNVLVDDGGFNGLVVRVVLEECTFSEEKDGVVLVTAGAGMVFDDLVHECVVRGLWGLENLSHIPGSVGATPIQNVGAYGVEVSQLIRTVHGFNIETHATKNFSNEECNFAYRDSFFKTSEGKKYIVTHVTFALTTSGKARCGYADLARYFSAKKVSDISLLELRAAVIEIRSHKFPDWSVVGTAGSFFKNPLIERTLGEKLRQQFPTLPLYEVDTTTFKCSLGFILDKVCGLKGFRNGKVGLYENQALVVVAEEGASASEILEFTNAVTKKVFEHTGIVIEREVFYLQ